MSTLINKTILVTGGAGFIGSHLCDSLLKEKVKLLIAVDNLYLGKLSNLNNANNQKNFLFIKLDITNYSKLNNLINKYSIDVIFHLATVPLELSIIQPKLCFDVNVRMMQNILESIRKSKKEIELISYSSSEVYGSAIYTPIDEKHPLLPHTPYAASKAAADLLTIAYSKTYNKNFVIIRPFNNYGPRQNEFDFAAIIPKTIKRLFQGKKPIIYGQGKQTRDFIYVQDTVYWTIKIYKNQKTRGKVINLASGIQIPIRTIINQISDGLQFTGKVQYAKTREGDVDIHEGGIKLAIKLVNFKLRTDFATGLKKTLAWYKKQFTNQNL